MHPAEFEYFAPQTVDEVLALLTTYGEDAKILAGGQSLVPMMKLRIASPRYLIDINRIQALKGLREVDGRLVCGALCRHAEIAASPIVRAHLPIMTDAAEHTADVQVRNQGTLGGSLSHADPGGDWPAVLLALNAEVTITGTAGSRTLPLQDFIVDAYTTQMSHDEMLTEVSIPLPPPPAGGAYMKFERRAGDFAVASVGVQLGLDRNGTVRQAAVSIGALGPMPVRAPRVEAMLTGQNPTPAMLDEGARLVRDQAEPFEDTRGSAEYKSHLAGVLFTHAYAAALARAQGRPLTKAHGHDFLRP